MAFLLSYSFLSGHQKSDTIAFQSHMKDTLLNVEWLKSIFVFILLVVFHFCFLDKDFCKIFFDVRQKGGEDVRWKMKCDEVICQK